MKGGKIEQLGLSKILTSSADCRSSKSCPKFKPNTPIESATLPLSTGSKYLLFLFTLGLFMSKTKLSFSAFCLASRYPNDRFYRAQAGDRLNTNKPRCAGAGLWGTVALTITRQQHKQNSPKTSVQPNANFKNGGTIYLFSVAQSGELSILKVRQDNKMAEKKIYITSLEDPNPSFFESSSVGLVTPGQGKRKAAAEFRIPESVGSARRLLLSIANQEDKGSTAFTWEAGLCPWSSPLALLLSSPSPVSVVRLLALRPSPACTPFAVHRKDEIQADRVPLHQIQYSKPTIS